MCKRKDMNFLDTHNKRLGRRWAEKIGTVELFELTDGRIPVLDSALIGFDFATPTANMGLARRAGKSASPSS
jgi:hypothetical protein